MINKKEMEKKILNAKSIAQKYELEVMFREFEKLEKVNDEYKINVLFIGGFSAGKSALLNCMIGNERLVENQSPETAIATEISYAAIDSMYSIKDDGTRNILSSISNINPEDYSYLVYNIDSETLMGLSDYVLVDTPGFDSGIERHNKALMKYVGKKGTAYVLVVDCEKGTLSQSALSYLNEVSNYSTDIAVVINKCDKKTDEDIEKIKNHINKLIVANCGKGCPIVTTSKYDEEVAQKLTMLIREFQPQSLYEKNVGDLVGNKIGELKQVLETLEKNKELDVSDIDVEIERRERAKLKIQEEMKKQQERMQRKLHSDVKEKIVNNIKAKLQNNARVLADAYKVSVDNFQEKVVAIVRPVILKSVENYESVAYEDIIKSINVSNLDIGVDAEKVGVLLNDILEKMENISSIFNATLGTTEYEIEDNHGDMKYKTITSLLAIATDVVAPPLEILIVFLPDILNLVKMFLGNNQEQKLVEAMQNEVIPQIVDKLRDELDISLSEIENILIQNIELSIAEVLEAENDALEQAKQKKSSMESDFDKYISELHADIAVLAE